MPNRFGPGCSCCGGGVALSWCCEFNTGETLKMTFYTDINVLDGGTVVSAWASGETYDLTYQTGVESDPTQDVACDSILLFNLFLETSSRTSDDFRMAFAQESPFDPFAECQVLFRKYSPAGCHILADGFNTPFVSTLISCSPLLIEVSNTTYGHFADLHR